MTEENKLSQIILSKAFAVHTELGPGLLESVYEKCLHYELMEEGIYSTRQKEIPLTYKGVNIDNSFRSDIIVENKVLVEIKAVDAIHDIFIAQTLTYLKFSKLRLGIILNFNVLHLKDGIRRVIL